MVAKVSDFGLSAKVKDRHLRLSTANMDASESDDESCSALQHGWTTMLEEKTAAKTRRRSTTERYNLSGHTGEAHAGTVVANWSSCFCWIALTLHVHNGDLCPLATHLPNSRSIHALLTPRPFP